MFGGFYGTFDSFIERLMVKIKRSICVMMHYSPEVMRSVCVSDRIKRSMLLWNINAFIKCSMETLEPF
jgi:hypothetical protein